MPREVAPPDIVTDARPGMYISDIEEFRREFVQIKKRLHGVEGEVARVTGLGEKLTGQTAMLEKVGIVMTGVARRCEDLTVRVEDGRTQMLRVAEAEEARAGRDEALWKRLDGLKELCVRMVKQAEAEGQGAAAGIVSRLEALLEGVKAQSVSERVESGLPESVLREDKMISCQALLDEALARLGDGGGGDGRGISSQLRSKSGRRMWTMGRVRIVEAGSGGQVGSEDERSAGVEEAIAEVKAVRRGGEVCVVVVEPGARVGDAGIKKAAERRVFLLEAGSLESFVRTTLGSVGGCVLEAGEARSLAAEVGRVVEVTGEGEARERAIKLQGKLERLRDRASPPPSSPAGENATRDRTVTAPAVAAATTREQVHKVEAVSSDESRDAVIQANEQIVLASKTAATWRQRRKSSVE